MAAHSQNGVPCGAERGDRIPGQGLLDGYLLSFVGAARERQLWGGAIDGIRGLDGRSIEDAVDGEYTDVRVMQKYQAFEMSRAMSKADRR